MKKDHKPLMRIGIIKYTNEKVYVKEIYLMQPIIIIAFTNF